MSEDRVEYEAMWWRVPNDEDFPFRGMVFKRTGPGTPILSLYGKTWKAVGDLCQQLGISRPRLRVYELNEPYLYKAGAEWRIPPPFWKVGRSEYHVTLWGKGAYAEWQTSPPYSTYEELAEWLAVFDIEPPAQEDFRTRRQLEMDRARMDKELAASSQRS